MEITTTTINRTSRNRAAINGLAVVGFVALLVTGVSLAIYSSRFLPQAVSGVGSGVNAAAVYFSSLFQPRDSELQVVPTVPFEDSGLVATTTPAATTTTAVTPATPRPVAPGPQTNNVYTVGGTPAPASLFGKPDLTVTVAITGYLTTDSTDSFIAAVIVPDNMKPAVKFTVANIGTNISGTWSFDAELPTSPRYTFHSDKQQSLLPGDRIDYVLGFDRSSAGTSKSITVTVDPDNLVNESNEGNNASTRTVDIQN